MVYNQFMAFSPRRFAKTRPWAAELIVAAMGLLVGAAVMPGLIFYAGVEALGRYEGASLGNLYSSLISGLREGSAASWAEFLGPYGLYLVFRGLRGWWRLSARFG